MPSQSPRKRDGRHSDPSSASLTPLTRGFSAISTGSRAQSLSPKKREIKQPLHIRMNLTENQMDKITDAFSQKVNNSPDRSRVQADESPTKPSLRRTKTTMANKKNAQQEVTYDDEPFSALTTFSELIPRAQPPAEYAASLAERRHRATPAPIRTDNNRRFIGSVVRRPNLEPVADVVSPLSPRQMYEAGGVAQPTQSSAYTSAFQSSTLPEPLRLPMAKKPELFEGGECPEGSSHYVEMSYDWEATESAAVSPEKISQSPDRRQLRRSKSTAQGLEKRTATSPVRPPRAEQTLKLIEESPMFSPFPFYFAGQGFVTEKKGEKTMIGEGGWLERTDQEGDKGKKNGMKKLGILDGIKKIAKDMTDIQGRKTQNAAKETYQAQQLPISLDAREQSLLYGELEYHLACALNTFITVQLEKGRLVTDKLKKVGDAWLQLGRPRVVGFRYDLETQLELVALHIDSFVFSGRRQGNPAEIAGLLHTMKVNARAMRIRTYCQPDSVIAKQLVDSQSLFNMLGVDRQTDSCLAEIAQFFQVCRDREEAKRERERQRAERARVEHEHKERWERERNHETRYYGTQGGQRYSEEKDWI